MTSEVCGSGITIDELTVTRTEIEKIVMDYVTY